jgi:hypothetical protein
LTVTPYRESRHIAIAPIFAISSLILLATAAVLCGGQVATSATPTKSVVWGALALAAYIAGLLCLAGPRSRAFSNTAGLGLASWKLGPWMLLWYSLTFGLATVIWSRPQPSPANQIAVDSVLRALWLVAVGVTCWTFGYFVGPSHVLRRIANGGVITLGNLRTGSVRSMSTPWIIYAIGVIARIISTATTGRFGYVGDPASALSTATGYEQILSELSLLCPLGVCAAALQVYRERLPGARFTLLSLFLVELAFGATAGGKENFVIAVLAVVIPISTVRRRLPKVAVIFSILIFFVVIIPFNEAYRTTVRGGSTALSTQHQGL